MMASPPKILVVEDENIIAADIQCNLLKMGYEVLSPVASGEEAIEKAEKFLPDLVLMDIVLRGEKDGIETARLIRDRYGIPVVFLTSFSDEDTLNRAQDTHPSAYLVKPFENKELQATLKIALSSDQRRRREAAAIRRRLEELEDANRKLFQFASIASHDLQEPLFTILGYSNILQSEEEDGQEVDRDHYINRIQTAASRMSQLLQSLSKYSATLSQTPHLEPTDLQGVVKEVLSDLGMQILQLNASVEVGTLPILKVDRLQMWQVFQNLIANALKFAKKGETPRIEIRSETLDPSWAKITVKDHGIGIENQYLQEIFQPFRKLHCSSEYKGSGLGLALCHAILQAHGGKISAASEPGHGTEFTLLFPLDSRAKN